MQRYTLTQKKPGQYGAYGEDHVFIGFARSKAEVREYFWHQKIQKKETNLIDIYDNKTGRLVQLSDLEKEGMKSWSGTKWYFFWSLPVIIGIVILAALVEGSSFWVLNTGFFIALAFLAGDFRGSYRK